jgi:DNA-binding NarL/FixJ family response regulator
MIVEDHEIVREGFKALLELDLRLKVVAEASCALEALNIIPKINADVVLVDLSLPDQTGIWLIERLQSLFPDLAMIVLTFHNEDQMVVQALRAGARGYLTKNASRLELMAAIAAVRQGGNYIQPSVALPVLQVLRSTANEIVTTREREILLQAANGHNNQQIAQELSLSVSTVKTHLRAIFGKLDVADRTQAVLEAVRRGIIPSPGSRPIGELGPPFKRYGTSEAPPLPPSP